MSTLWIHAGPHKTASTYIQQTLISNKSYLRKKGLLVCPNMHVAKRFRRLFGCGDFESIAGLKFIQKPVSGDKLLSTETLHPQILAARSVDQLKRLSEKIGTKIGLIFYLRNQPEWINSMYCHGIRRMYHSADFADFVRSWFDQKNYKTLDLCKKFENICSSGFETKFIVLGGVRRSDPVSDLLHEIGVEFEPSKLVPVAEGSSNIQPGAKGIWLSKSCKVICDLLAVDTGDLSLKARKVRTIAIRKNWHLERFFGFDNDLYQETVDHFAPTNDAFSRQFLAGAWKDHFPLKSVVKKEYLGPADGDELAELKESFVEALVGMNFPSARLDEAVRLFLGYAKDTNIHASNLGDAT
jgi:hypothetical protein